MPPVNRRGIAIAIPVSGRRAASRRSGDETSRRLAGRVRGQDDARLAAHGGPSLGEVADSGATTGHEPMSAADDGASDETPLADGRATAAAIARDDAITAAIAAAFADWHPRPLRLCPPAAGGSDPARQDRAGARKGFKGNAVRPGDRAIPRLSLQL